MDFIWAGFAGLYIIVDIWNSLRLERIEKEMAEENAFLRHKIDDLEIELQNLKNKTR